MLQLIWETFSGFPLIRNLNYDKYFVVGSKQLFYEREYNSNNTERLNVQQIKEKLLSLKYIQDELKDWNKR